MASANNAIRNHHAKMYIDEVFADTLKQEGFINPDGKSISWYRVVNNELVHAVYFHATWGQLPLMGMRLESNVFPLFNKIPYYSSIYSSSSNRHCGYRSKLISDVPDERGTTCMAPYSDDILVYAVRSGERGLYTLKTDALPWFKNAMTLRDYYSLIENEFHNEKNPFDKTPLQDVATLSVFYGNTINYENYSECLANLIPCLGDDATRERLVATKAAMDSGNREEFFAHLEVQKQKNIRWLKKMGIIA